jgi:hypothetical protein
VAQAAEIARLQSELARPESTEVSQLRAVLSAQAAELTALRATPVQSGALFIKDERQGGVPPEIVIAAERVGRWFGMNGIRSWVLGPCQSRYTPAQASVGTAAAARSAWFGGDKGYLSRANDHFCMKSYVLQL